MLNISSNSWHYRLRKRFFDSDPKDLCSYFWSCLLSIIVFPIELISRGRMYTIVSWFMFGSLAVWALYNFIIDPLDFLIMLAIAIAILVAIVLLLIAIVLAVDAWRKHKFKKRRDLIAPVPGDSMFSLLWGMMKAKKRRVCPLITVDGDRYDT